jgi:hypothetical protein
LVGFWLGGYFPLAGVKGLFDHPYLLPEQIEPEQLLSSLLRHLQQAWRASGDLFPVATPLFGLPWLEAIIGCPIVASLQSETIWAEPLGTDFPDADQLRERALSPRNTWTVKLRQCLQVLAEALRGTTPFGTPILRGPTDLMAALMGGTAMVLALQDRPEESVRLLDVLADIWTQVAGSILDFVPRFQGGYGCFRGVWAPGRTAILQEDASAVLSPQLYERLVLARDRRILAEFPFAMMHNHSSNLGIMVEGLTGSDALAAFELTVDPPPAPCLRSLLPILRKIQENKPLVVFGSLNEQDLEVLSGELSPSGLAICVEVESIEEAARLKRRFGGTAEPNCD